MYKIQDAENYEFEIDDKGNNGKKFCSSLSSFQIVKQEADLV